jgi:acyl-CoA thioester hydrolase
MPSYQPKSTPFLWESRVYFGDTDAAGVVYHGRYVYWMEAVRIEFLRHIGCPYSTFIEEKIAFMPVSLSIDYKRPLKFEDLFRLEISVAWCKKASFCIQNTFYLGNQICTTGTVILACVNERNWKACPIPNRFINALQDFENRPKGQ